MSHAWLHSQTLGPRTSPVLPRPPLSPWAMSIHGQRLCSAQLPDWLLFFWQFSGIVATVTARPSPFPASYWPPNPFTLSFCRVCLWLTQWLKCLGLVFAFCLVFDWKTLPLLEPEWVGVRLSICPPVRLSRWFSRPLRCPNSIRNRYRIGHVTCGPRINYLASVAQIELCNKSMASSEYIKESA